MKALVKVGGSVFDLGPQYVSAVCKNILQQTRNHDLVIAVGGGPSLDILKNIRGEIGEELYQYMATKAIVVNAGVLEALIPDSRYVQPTEILRIDNLLKQGIVPIVSHIDKSLLTGSLPNKNSTTDTHDIAIAEILQIRNIVFIKDTKGVFDRDPNTYSDAVFIKTATPSDFFSKQISRIGTDGTDKHLIENDALTLLQDSTNIEALSIIDCKDQGALDRYLQNQDVGSMIVKH